MFALNGCHLRVITVLHVGKIQNPGRDQPFEGVFHAYFNVSSYYPRSGKASVPVERGERQTPLLFLK